MAQGNNGNEPRLMPAKKLGSNSGISDSQSVPKASSIFKGPKQDYSEVMNPNSKAGKFPG